MTATAQNVPRMNPDRKYGGCAIVPGSFDPTSPHVWLVCECGDNFRRAKAWVAYQKIVTHKCDQCRAEARKRKAEPGTDAARRCVKMMASGVTVSIAARECGVSQATADVWRVRWVRVPALEARIKELEAKLAQAGLTCETA